MKLKKYNIHAEYTLANQESDSGNYIIWNGRLQILADKDEIKPLIIKGNYYLHCPHCDRLFSDQNAIENYCGNCGQRLANYAKEE